jgi:hypothetical protein
MPETKPTSKDTKQPAPKESRDGHQADDNIDDMGKPLSRPGKPSEQPLGDKR